MKADLIEAASKEAFIQDYEKAYAAERQIREEANKLKHTMTEKSFRFMFRVTLQFLDNSLGTVSYDQDAHRKDLERADADGSTGHHLAVFECELKTPPTMMMVDHSIDEFVMGSHLPFRNWRLVDVDNFMKGNPPFSDFLDSGKWEKDVQAYEDGKVKAQGYDIQTRQQLEDKVESIKEYSHYANTMREPNSNDKIYFIQQGEEEARLKAASEKASEELAAKQGKKGKKKALAAGEVEEAEISPPHNKDEAHNLSQ